MYKIYTKHVFIYLIFFLYIFSVNILFAFEPTQKSTCIAIIILMFAQAARVLKRTSIVVYGRCCFAVGCCCLCVFYLVVVFLFFRCCRFCNRQSIHPLSIAAVVIVVIPFIVIIVGCPSYAVVWYISLEMIINSMWQARHSNL